MTADLAPDPEKKSRRNTDPKPITDARLAANRSNAQKSTGPTSPEGKSVSSRNSTKHGLRALVVDVPGEDPATFDTRFHAWNNELNPSGDDVVAYTVALLVRQSQGLDRAHVVKTARVAKLARDAVKDRSIARARGIEEAIRIMLDDPDIAVRRLRETPEGCDLLIKEWGYLKAPLIDPPQWDLGDAARAHCLMADFSVARAKAPGLLAIPTRWIEEHREVSRKLKENERPTWIDWTRRYMTKDEHEYDKERVDELREASKAGQVWVSELIEAQIQGLVELREGLLAEDAIDVEQASLRARVDVSDEGRLIHRYEQELHRGFFKTLTVLKAGVAAWIKSPQDKSVKDFTRESPSAPMPAAAPGSSPANPPNEATDGARTHKPDLSRMVPEGSNPPLNIWATGPKDQSHRE